MDGGKWVVWVVPFVGCGEPIATMQCGERRAKREARAFNWTLESRGGESPFLDRYVALPYGEHPEQRERPS